MPTFEEEALKRAQQMHSRVPPYKREENSTAEKPVKSKNSQERITLAEQKNESCETDKQPGILDFLMKDKEQSLILLLLLLLYGENADPALLLALMYLLI